MRLFGHPVHAIVVTFPVALFCLGPICDLVATLGFAPVFAEVARLCLVAGLCASGLALITGFWDYVSLDGSSRVAAIAARHGIFAFSGTSLFAVALALRSGTVQGLPLIALELGGALLIGVTGWLGGHLVFHHGVGVRNTEHREDGVG